jgi:hypothetical protein
MIFNELDKQSTTTLCTLAKLMGNNEQHEETLIAIGQNLGVSRDETLMILTEWDEQDVIDFNEEGEKVTFVKHCITELAFSMPQSSKKALFETMTKELGLSMDRLN